MDSHSENKEETFGFWFELEDEDSDSGVEGSSVGQWTSHPGCTFNLVAGKLYFFTAAKRHVSVVGRDISRASHKLKNREPAECSQLPLDTVPQHRAELRQGQGLDVHWANPAPHQHWIRKRRAKIFQACQSHEHMQSSRRSAHYFSYAVPIGKGKISCT